MGEAAAVLEQGAPVPAAVDGQPGAPEAQLPGAEGSPEGTPKPGTEKPGEEGLPPVSSGQPSEQDAKLQVYQEILSKADKDPQYQMTDDEAEAFLFIQDQISAGRLKDPGPADKSGKPPEAKEKQDKGKKDQDEPEGGDPGELPDGLTDASSSVLLAAMKRVGAKDITELDGKIEGLINHMKSSGGKQGSELAAMRKKEAAHMSWMEDLRKGTPAALEFLEKVTGKKFSPVLPKEGDHRAQGPKVDEPPADGEDGDLEQYLDEGLAREVQSLKKMVKQQAEIITRLSQTEQKREEFSQRKTAADGWVDDVVELVTDPKNKGTFNLTPSEARALAKQYWSPEGHQQPVHPKFQQVHELIKFAHERSMPDLQTAHIVWLHERGIFAKKLIDATRDGQKSVQHEPSKNAFISQRQAKEKTNVPNPNITEDNVAAMERGDFRNIPDDWMDKDGNLIPSKVPERFHKAAFGRLGKPTK